MSGESRRGRSIVSALFVSIVSVFIVITTWQVARGVFGKGVMKASVAPAPICVAGVSRLNDALDRALAAASPLTDEHAIDAAFANAARPEWDDSSKVEADCAGTQEGQDAFAALLRLRRADESFLHREVAELSPMKQDVEAYLR
jgi:hypothetical protein